MEGNENTLELGLTGNANNFTLGAFVCSQTPKLKHCRPNIHITQHLSCLDTSVYQRFFLFSYIPITCLKDI